MFRLLQAMALVLVFPGITGAQVVIGQPAPPISLEAVQNAPGIPAEHLSWDGELANKTVVLEFWATWCGPCIASIPHLNEIADHFADNPDVVFLSVTDEDGATIEAFRQKVPMRSWIGHDTARSIFSGFGVQGIPQAFVVHNGKVVWAGHPQMLNTSIVDLAIHEEPIDAIGLPMGETVNAKGDSMPIGRQSGLTMQPGLDPYSAIKESPIFQVIVRSPDPMNGGTCTTRSRKTLLGTDVRSIVAALWDKGRAETEADEAVTEERFDVIVYADDEHYEQARELVLSVIGVRIEPERRVRSGYRVSIASDGVKLPGPKIDQSVGFTMTYDETSLHIESVAMTLRSLLNHVSSNFGVPILDETGQAGDTLYSFDLVLPVDSGALAEVLRDQVGLDVEPVGIEKEVLVIHPR